MDREERREKLSKIIEAVSNKIKGVCFGGFSYYPCECYCGISIFFTRDSTHVDISISEEDFTICSVDELTHQAIRVIKNEILDYYFK